jgi:hypothetical protein
MIANLTHYQGVNIESIVGEIIQDNGGFLLLEVSLNKTTRLLTFTHHATINLVKAGILLRQSALYEGDNFVEEAKKIIVCYFLWLQGVNLDEVLIQE